MEISSLKKWTLFLFLFSFGTLAHAQSLTMESVKFAGSGCPAGTVDASLSPDGRALSVLFSAFTIEGVGAAEKNCQIIAQMRAPKGYRVHMAHADLRGFNALPVGSQSRFDTTIRFTDWRNWSKTQSLTQNFSGPVADGFFVQTETPYSRWGNCGGMLFYIVLDTRFVMQNPTTEAALLSLDSSDILSGPASVYHLELDSCRGGPKKDKQRKP